MQAAPFPTPMSVFESRLLYWTAIATVTAIAALFFGPWVALWAQDRREKKRKEAEHRLWVFRTLSATRHLIMDWRQVEALNLIPFDFEKDEKVMNAFRAYLKTLEFGKPADGQATRSALNNLIVATGEAAGYKNPSVETIEKLTRDPQGYYDNAVRRLSLEQGMIQVLNGERRLRIEIHEPIEPKPIFPEPPPKK